MANCRRLRERARTSPQSLSFRDAQGLAECFGFQLMRVRGSHHIYRAPDAQTLVNLQERGGMAKAYQVRQLLKAITAQVSAPEGKRNDPPR